MVGIGIKLGLGWWRKAGIILLAGKMQQEDATFLLQEDGTFILLEG